MVMIFLSPCGVLALLAIAWFVFNVVAAAGINIPSTLDGPFEPVTVPFDSNLRGGAVDLPDSDPRVQRRVKGFEPEQISVSLSAHYDSVWISWITGSLPLLCISNFNRHLFSFSCLFTAKTSLVNSVIGDHNILTLFYAYICNFHFLSFSPCFGSCFVGLIRNNRGKSESWLLTCTVSRDNLPRY